MDINPQLLVSAQAKFQEVTERDQCEESLYAFLKKGWKYIDPAPFIGGWHLEAIAEHLQAVTDGQIRRLIINVPPRTSKPVAHDAEIWTKSGIKKLDQIVVGDEVWTHKLRWRAVLAVHQQGVLPVLRITTVNGHVVEAASDHPFLTLRDGWVEAGKLQPGSMVMGGIPENHFWGYKIAEVVPSGMKTCACLTVDEDQSFNANEFFVHNSSICSVAWPAWTWAQSRIGPCSGPHVQFLSASYAQTLSLRDSVKNRRLIESPFYKKYWGNRFSMTSDVNTKGRFENDRGGYRIATSVDGALTGEGAQIILIDDPHNATESESELVRTSTLQWWDEAMSTRLNDQHTGAYVVIMQRLHQEDLTGHIVRREANDWTWLMLPMEHEKARHCVTMVNGAKFWEDPRTEENELLCPDRFNAEAIKRLKTSLREFGTAGQLQQSPIPRGGGIIKEEWWGQYLEHTLPTFEYIIASLDTAYTEKEENDASALTIWGIYKNDNEQPRIMLIAGWQERLALHELVEAVVSTCTTKPLPQTSKYRGYRRVAIDKLIIESKASGISVYQELQRVIGFSGQFAIDLFNPSKLGDKWARVHSVAHLFSEGLVYVPWPKEKDGPNKGQAGPNPYKWAEDIIDQITIFPRGAHDDFVDSMSMGLRWLRDSGLLLRNEEHTHDELEERTFRGRLMPLYPT